VSFETEDAAVQPLEPQAIADGMAAARVKNWLARACMFLADQAAPLDENGEPDFKLAALLATPLHW